MREDQRRAHHVDVLVVGAGPAGLAAAAALAGAGAGRVEVVERERDPGGVPRHSHHPGFGLRDLHRSLSGPAYAHRRAELAVAAGATIRTETTATGFAGARALDIVSPGGLERIEARAVLLATGARERPRAARLVAGARCRGVLTTGELQQAVYLERLPIGSRAVVVGAEHVSFSACLTLQHAGVAVAALVTPLPAHQSYAAFRLGAALRFRAPVRSGSTVTAIHGRGRVESVEVRAADGRSERIGCDTVVFSGDWIPDNELARRGGLEIDAGTRGPAVDTALRASAPGIFATGNLVHPVETADACALAGEAAATAILRHLAGELPPASTVALRVEPPLAWVAPNRVAVVPAAPPRGRLLVWASAFASRPRAVVVQDGRTLHEERLGRRLVPNRPLGLDAGWLGAVAAAGGTVVIRIADGGSRPKARIPVDSP
jgi:thioredoxin reductase